MMIKKIDRLLIHQQLMKLFLFINIILNIYLTFITTISMTPEQYRELIMNRCYNRTEYREPFILGQKKPIGATIDYFVTLTEKLEQHYSQLNAKEILTLILKRFHYDGIRNLGYEEYFQQIRYPQMQQENDLYRRKFNEMLFKDQIDKIPLPSFSEDLFNEDEKCAMFFMISHTVNKTALDNNGNHVVKEFGIVSVLNDDKIAISLNYVLLGLASAFYDLPKMKFMADMEELEINPLYALTLSDKLAITSIESIENYESMFGSKGNWNSTYCQTEYLIKDKNNRHVATMAEINGGIDGWIIGNKLISENGRILQKLKLSTIIDRYYSHDGLSIDCGICKVDFFPENFMDNLYRTARGYAFYWNKEFKHENIEYNRIDGFVNTMTPHFMQYIELSNRIKHDECSRISQFRRIDMQIETKSDLYILIDNNNANEYSRFQLETITKLLIKLKSLDSLGRITIMVNAHQGYDSEHIANTGEDLRRSLHILAYNTSSIQKATCRLAWYNYRETTINDKKNLLYELIHFFERDNITNVLNGNSKNLIWFSLKSNNYEKLTERDRAYYYQYRWNLLYYLNIRIFFITTFDQNIDDDLNNMIINKNDWFRVNTINFVDDSIVDKLTQKIMQTPLPIRIEFDYNNNKTIIDQKFLLGKNRKQYWALYPKYFLDSKFVYFKFKSNLGRIRICLGRYLFPETNYTQCRESNEMIEFTIANPCRWKVIESCAPIYFTVISKDDHHHNDHNLQQQQYQTNKCFYLNTNGNFIEDVCISRTDQIWQLSIDGIKFSDNSSKILLIYSKIYYFIFIFLLSLVSSFYYYE